MAIVTVCSFVWKEKVEQFLIQNLETSLGKALGTSVSIEDIDYKLFDKIVIRRLTLKDTGNEDLLSADEIECDLGIMPLFSGEVVLDFLKLSNTTFNLKKNENGTNLDFLLSRFKKEGKMTTRFRRIILENCFVHFVNEQKKQKLGNGVFNPNDIRIGEINSEINIDLLKKNTFEGRVNYLNFKELNSNFIFKNLQTDIRLNDSSLLVSELLLQTQHSKLEFDTLTTFFYSFDELKDLSDKVTFGIKLQPSYITLSDFGGFVPTLRKFSNKLSIDGEIKGTPNQILCPNLLVNYGSSIHFDGDFSISDLINEEKPYISADINKLDFNVASLQDILAIVRNKPTIFPQRLSRLGKCTYKGKIDGFFEKIELLGTLYSGIGNVHTDIFLESNNNFSDIKIDGNIQTRNLRLGEVLDPKWQIGTLTFNTYVCTMFGDDTPIQGNINLLVDKFNFRGYDYENLKAKGHFIKKAFDGEIHFDDKNGEFHLLGAYDLDKSSPKFNFDARLSHFCPNAMNLIDTFPNLSLSLAVRSNFEGGTLDNMNGTLSFDSLDIRNGEKEFFLPQLLISSSEKNNERNLSFQSELVSGFVAGEFIFASLKQSVMHFANKYIPSISTEEFLSPLKNDFTYKIDFSQLNQLCDVFDFPWRINDNIGLFGFYDDINEKISFNLQIPNLSKQNGKVGFENIKLVVNNFEEKLNVEGKISLIAPKFTTNFHSQMAAKNDSLDWLVSWYSNKENSFEGEFFSQTVFAKENEIPTLKTQIFPTQFVLSDSIWDIKNSIISTDFAKIAIDSFSIYRQNQFILVDGNASAEMTDTLHLDLQNIDLRYISDFIPRQSIVMTGDATGSGFVTNTFEKPIFEANVSVPEFSFNHAHWGKVNASSDWNNEKKALEFFGNVTNKEHHVADIKGYYFFANDSLDLLGKANSLPISFLDYYLQKITLGAKGFASGDVHVFGKKKKITVAADAFVHPAELSVDFLNTSYTFTDSIILKPDSILFRNIAMTDEFGNKGKINGYVSHNFFEDIKYFVNIDCNEMQVMQSTPKESPYFYGDIFASGNVKIFGDEKNTTITANAETEPKTRVVIPMGDETATAMDNSFVSFVQPIDSSTIEVPKLITPTSSSNGSNIQLSLMVNVNQDAEVCLIIDPSAGDMLKAVGEGDLKVDFNVNTSDLKIYGNYVLDRGEYTFTFQNALRKQFSIQQGSSLYWSGVPYDAEVNINAGYQLSASLVDLFGESILSTSNRNSVPVLCLVNLTGNLMHPNIKFDITLPNSDDELNRSLKSTINTEEMMNRQIVYLLAFNKFYTPEYLKTNSQNELLALASSTLSSQLNSWASQLLDKWDFGVNFRTSGEGETRSNEYEFAFLYSPNNKLFINGNLGYRDDNFSASKFIGDVDVEYKLTRRGKLRAKAYNHTNDYKEFKTALTTQGVGLVYRENFSSLKDLVAEWKEDIRKSKEERAIRKEKRAARKKEKEEKKNQEQKEEVK